MFMSNASGAYVMSANTTARIVQSDIIVQNGVVHLIDEVLVNTMMNTTAAAAAYTSNTAAAATIMDPTGAITATSMPAASGTGGTSASSSTGAGVQLRPFSLTSSIVASIVAVAGVMTGGGLTLM